MSYNNNADGRREQPEVRTRTRTPEMSAARLAATIPEHCGKLGAFGLRDDVPSGPDPALPVRPA
jgi:hypothetical protein